MKFRPREHVQFASASSARCWLVDSSTLRFQTGSRLTPFWPSPSISGDGAKRRLHKVPQREARRHALPWSSGAARRAPRECCCANGKLPPRRLHRRHAIGDQQRLRHQARAETALLHSVRRAADIEIDFVEAEILADFRRRRQIARMLSGFAAGACACSPAFSQDAQCVRYSRRARAASWRHQRCG
jgi:hypothetical protein